MRERKPSKPALELKHENGKVFVYENEQCIKSFNNELMALGFINRLKFEKMALK
ncbi:hypothetical protein [Flammeovirga sp. EKP202]|uniref:hypothetical protein n=1 Tax=Flammeovirga sp. EKP202 TaxID=2770592 RepID=UPI00165EF54B|nr:hypothetical protein [Flammeovirga sp. EKP202]MBD0400660.1 hypothetical protein [Flammeovirga sp. EKP202]